jgi:hypothetical protein
MDAWRSGLLRTGMHLRCQLWCHSNLWLSHGLQSFAIIRGGFISQVERFCTRQVHRRLLWIAFECFHIPDIGSGIGTQQA